MMASGPGAHQPVALNTAQLQHQQQAQAHATEQAKRRSRKPTDKTMPDGLEEAAIGDGTQRYKELRDFERRLDAAMTRKRLDIVDSVSRNAKVRTPSVAQCSKREIMVSNRRCSPVLRWRRLHDHGDTRRLCLRS